MSTGLTKIIKPQKCGHILVYKIPNYKTQITNKSQILMLKFQTTTATQFGYWDLSIGHYLIFII